MQATETEHDLGLLKRRKLGVINIARRLHLAIVGTKNTPNRSKALADVAYLQESLANWKNTNSHFAKAVKAMAEAAIAEAATDKRLATKSDAVDSSV